MRPVRAWLAGVVLAGLGLALIITPDVRGGDIGFVEDFALAKDRTTALKQLIPGTEDYYYYHCLHYLQPASSTRSKALTALVRTAPADRPADRDPDAPRTPHLRQEPREVARLHPQPPRPALRPPEGDASAPSRTCQSPSTNRSSPAPRSRPARSRGGAISTTSRTCRSTGWPPRNSNWELRRNLLQRLQRPDIADLPRLVVEDLKPRTLSEFG